MAEGSSILSSVFSLKTVFKVATAATLFFGGGLVDYSLFHNNLGGQWLVKLTDPFFQAAFDFVGITSLGAAPEFANALTTGSGVGVNPNGSLALL